MSKSITIPKDRDPFVVIVNGVEYKYTAGATVTVPDSVADVIEKYENAKPKPDPNAGAGSHKCDWNKMVNKPFGETLDTLTWGGNTDGLHNLMGVFRVSDVVPTPDDFANGGSLAFNNGEPIEFKRDDLSIEELAEGKYMVALEIDYSGTYFTIIPDLGEQMAAAGYKAGVYFFNKEERYLSSLTINGYTGFSSIKRLDEKYMPILTSPSGKKFTLSVDDSGAVTATEA